MLFFCVGAFLWYCLLFRSRVVPRVLSVWGLVALPSVLVATLMYLSNNSPLAPSFALYVPYVPFELVIGLWLLTQGRPPCTDGRGVRMKAIVQDRYGSPDVLELKDIDKPVVGDDDLLVRVYAAGVDPGVWHLMTGLPYLVRFMGFGSAQAQSAHPGPWMSQGGWRQSAGT